MKYKSSLKLLLGLLLCTMTAMGQSENSEKNKERLYGNGLGVNVALTNSGFGIGGFWQRALNKHYAVTAEFTIGAGKDAREQRVFGYFGESYIPGKANYLLMMPIQFGIQRRLFSEVIQDNFRPFIHVAAGPTVGWVSPYFRDTNGNFIDDEGSYPYDSIGALPKGEPRIGAGAIAAVGASFGSSYRTTQNLRFGVQFNYFPDGIQLLQKLTPDIGPKRFFVSPMISLSVGRSSR